MYLSQQKAGPGSNPGTDFASRLVAFLRRSAFWIGGIVFAALAAIGTFFFAMAAIVGTFIIAGAIAFAWFVFKMLGPKAFMPKGFSPQDFDNGFGKPRDRDAGTSETLNATRGPEGWTVNRDDKFGR